MGGGILQFLFDDVVGLSGKGIFSQAIGGTRLDGHLEEFNGKGIGVVWIIGVS